jgi:hypothetical protein
VTVVKLSIEDEEDLVVIDEWRNYLCLRPFGFRIELFGEAVPAGFICNRDFGEVVIQDGLMEMHNKLERKSRSAL